MTGIGIQVAGYSKICTLSYYHLRIVCSLAQLSTVTHIVTLLALREYFIQHKLVRNFRVFFMTVNMILLIVNMVLVIIGSGGMVTRALCIFFIRTSTDALEILPFCLLSIFPVLGTVALIGVFSRSIPSTLFKRLYQFFEILTTLWVGLFLILFSIEIKHAHAMGGLTSHNSIYTIEGAEKEWSYGQILPLLLLTLPVFNALEIYCGMVIWLC